MNRCDEQLAPSLLQALFENLPVGILVLDPTGNVITANKTVCNILGLQKDKTLGKGWAEIFDLTDSNNTFHQVILDVIQGELPLLNRTVPYLRKDGTNVDLGILSSFIKEDGTLSGIATIIQDMTAITSHHEHQSHTSEQGAHVVSEREAALLNLAGAVAHQVRNPVAAIGGQANRMMKDCDNDPRYDRLEIIKEESLKLENIVKGLAEYASIHMGNPEWIYLDDFFHTVAATKHNSLCTLSCSITIYPSPVPVKVWADANLLALITKELIANTLFFTPQEKTPEIRFSFTRTNKAFLVYYDDNSCGIAPHILPFVFNPFYSTKSSGVGMGLCKVRRSMMVMGGGITIDSDKRTGTRFVLEFPVAESSKTKGSNYDL